MTQEPLAVSFLAARHVPAYATHLPAALSPAGSRCFAMRPAGLA